MFLACTYVHTYKVKHIYTFVYIKVDPQCIKNLKLICLKNEGQFWVRLGLKKIELDQLTIGVPHEG